MLRWPGLQLLIMVNLLFILLFCTLGLSYSPLTGCFYTQRIKIENATYFDYTTGGYNFSLTWIKPQGINTKFSHTLVSYKSQMGNTFISFKGSIPLVTSTGGVFLFEPENGSTIVYAIFSIVLIQTCPGNIDLQLVQCAPTELSKPLANRTSSTQMCRVNSALTISTDHYNYLISVHLAAFQLTAIDWMMQLYIKSQDAVPGFSEVNISITSQKIYGNVYKKIWFTFIMVQFTSFTTQVGVYRGQEFYILNPSGPTTNINNFDIPKQYNWGNQTQVCFFSLNWQIAPPTNTTMEINYVDQSTTSIVNITSLISQQIYLVRYEVFCLIKCDPGTFAIFTSFWFCGICSSYSTNCELCTYDKQIAVLTCHKCFAGTFLMMAENKCYSVCPPGYYGSNSTKKCALCNNVCYTCNDAANCLSCKVGWPAQGGCTTIEGCLVSLSPVICTKCNAEGMFYLSSKICKCIPGYFLVTHFCTNIVGCIATTLSQNKTICLLCNSMRGYMMVNGSCACKEDYIFNGSACIDFCGDGKVINDECDDGNAESGDGCSSTCTIEKNFGCYGGTLSPSTCVYQKFDITLSVAKITKTDLLNQGIFVLSVKPKIGTFSKLNLTNLLAFSCGQTISTRSMTYSNGSITIIIDFYEDLEGNPAHIFMSLDRNYFLQANISLSFSMESTKGAKLILTDDLEILEKCKLLLTLVSVIVLAVFTVSTFVHKMIEVELIFPLQIVYLVHMVNRNYSQSFSLLKYLGFASWNLQGISKSTVNIDSAQQNLVFSSGSQQFTLAIVAGLLITAALTFAIIKAVITATEQESPNSTLIFTVQRLLLCLYKILLFPFTVAFLPTFFLMSNTHNLHQLSSFSLIVQALFPLFMVAASLAFFYEWRVLLVAQEKHSLFQGLPMCNQKHIPVYLSFMLISTLLLSYSYQHQLSSLPILSIILGLIILTWIIFGRPYESNFHNLGVLMNILPAVIFLAYDSMRDYQPSLKTGNNETYLIFSIIGSAFLSSLTSISRIAFEVYLWKRMEERQMQKKAQKKEAKLKKKQELLDKLKIREQPDYIPNKEINFAYLNKFGKHNNCDQSQKIRKKTLSSISVAHQNPKNSILERKKKLKNTFLESGSKSNRKKIDF